LLLILFFGWQWREGLHRHQGVKLALRSFFIKIIFAKPPAKNHSPSLLFQINPDSVTYNAMPLSRY
jgi:hypothetical protein